MDSSAICLRSGSLLLHLNIALCIECPVFYAWRCGYCSAPDGPWWFYDICLCVFIHHYSAFYFMAYSGCVFLLIHGPRSLGRDRWGPSDRFVIIPLRFVSGLLVFDLFALRFFFFLVDGYMHVCPAFFYRLAVCMPDVRFILIAICLGSRAFYFD